MLFAEALRHAVDAERLKPSSSLRESRPSVAPTIPSNPEEDGPEDLEPEDERLALQEADKSEHHPSLRSCISSPADDRKTWVGSQSGGKKELCVYDIGPSRAASPLPSLYMVLCPHC